MQVQRIYIQQDRDGMKQKRTRVPFSLFFFPKNGKQTNGTTRHDISVHKYWKYFRFAQILRLCVCHLRLWWLCFCSPVRLAILVHSKISFCHIFFFILCSSCLWCCIFPFFTCFFFCCWLVSPADLFISVRFPPKYLSLYIYCGRSHSVCTMKIASDKCIAALFFGSSTSTYIYFYFPNITRKRHTLTQWVSPHPTHIYASVSIVRTRKTGPDCVEMSFVHIITNHEISVVQAIPIYSSTHS